MVSAVAIGWGVFVGSMVAGRVTRVRARIRVRGLANPVTRRRMWHRLDLGPATRVARDVRRRATQRRSARVLDSQLPVAIDLLAVAVGSGATPVAAVRAVAVWGPDAVAERFRRLDRAFLLGEPFDRACHHLGEPTSALGGLGTRLAEAALLGAPLLETLHRLAADARANSRRCAEVWARTVPVRLLFPLVFLVLPAFGLITVVPAIDAGLRGG